MAEGSELSFFDLHIVHDNFDRALVEDYDVNIKAYLDAYNELYKVLVEQMRAEMRVEPVGVVHVDDDTPP
ncbi:unnamed protein product [Chilo suppressalis]|uniref:Uncharacterized protein n=1 Tax=Chilo suppressalis TaxID=168631 RepID=A0ABN8BBP7_CHISP|nr:unnamed protein product [Chilo suppressalis]